MANIKEVAKSAGVSVATVSKALNGYSDISDETKLKIQKIASEIGYMPSSYGQTLARKKSYTIGIVFEENTGFGLAHPFFGELLSIIKVVIESYGYDMLLMSKNYGPYVKCYLDHCIQKGVDGIIVISASLDEENYLRLVKTDIPTVLVDFENENRNTISTDNYGASLKAVEHLINNNHKKIGYIRGDLYRYVGKKRYQGYLDALEKHNIAIDESIIFDAPNYTIDEGYEIAKKIAKLDELPTSIACCADAVAIGLLNGLIDNKIKVPDDISIIGFDDIVLSKIVNPQLTTIAQNKQEIGKLAAQTLIQNINDKNHQPVHYIIDGILVERKTVKKLDK